MKMLLSVALIVAVQGAGLAQQKGTSINPREVMEQMKARDTIGIFGRGKAETLPGVPPASESRTLIKTYGQGNPQETPSGFRVLAPVKSVRKEPFSPLVEKEAIGEAENFGFRELTGYDKLRAIQESGLMETTPAEEMHKSYSFAPSQRHPLQLDAFPLGKNQALSYDDEPTQTIKFKDSSEMPKGGIILNTSEGPVFLRYNVLCALNRDGTKRAIAIKKWDEVVIRVADVVEIPVSSR